MEKELKAFRKLIVWQRAHELTLMIYVAGEKFPKHELFGLTSQIRRSAVSVESNMEGYALGTGPNYLRHLNISVGSLAETESHIELAHDLGYLSNCIESPVGFYIGFDLTDVIGQYIHLLVIRFPLFGNDAIAL